MKNGDIWLVDLSDAKGHEQRGVRPAIIIGAANGLVLVVPLTSSMSSARFSYTYLLTPDQHNGLEVESIALVFQITALDRERFVRRIGTLDGQQRLAILALIRDLMGLE
ncbi:MAG: type II toxin-antitoxin system PemK/MazF family toxin [Methanoregula sp.]